MRSVLHALVWDSLRHSGWTQLMMVATCLLPMIVYASILSVAPSIAHEAASSNALAGSGDPVMFLLEVSMLPFVIFVLVLGAGTGHANFHQLATKPISNLSLAAWKTVGGSVLLAIETGLIVGLYNTRFHTTWPLAGTVLFTIAVWCAAQPFFCLAGKSFLGTLVTMVPIALMNAWFITRYKPMAGGHHDWNEISLSESLQLLAVIGLFAWLTVHCVALARRHENLEMPAILRRWWQAIIDWFALHSEKRRPFRSPARALFWYHWRWSGFQLSICMLIFLMINCLSNYSRLGALDYLAVAINSAYMLTIVPGLALGVLNAFQLENLQISGLRTRNADGVGKLDAIGSFQATRPVTDVMLARSSLWVCLATIGVVSGLWFLLISPIMVLAASQGRFTQIFFSTEARLGAVPMVALFSWTSMSNILSVISTGRTKQLGSFFIALTFASVVVSASLSLTENYELHSSVIRATWIFLCVSIGVFSVWAFTRAYQRGMIQFFEITLLLLVAVAVVLLAISQVKQIDSNSLAGILCLGMLIILPWAATPLAIQWNRHR